MIFVDSNVPMYLVGAAHPNKDRLTEVLARIAQQGETLVTSVEVYQELVHRYSTMRGLQAMDDAFAALDEIVDNVLSYGVAEVHAAKEIVHRMVHVSARDALHLAVMNSARISRILSFDRGFDAHPGIERLS